MSGYGTRRSLEKAFGYSHPGDPLPAAIAPGFDRARSYPARMPNFQDSFLPTWRDPPTVQYAEDFFVYTVHIAAIAAGASLQVPLNIEADSAFEWIQTTASAFCAADTAPYVATNHGQLLMQITDGASSRQLFNMPLPMATCAGLNTGGWNANLAPLVLPIPRRFMAKSTVLFNFYNPDSVAYTDLCVQLVGRKIFSRDDPALLGNIARFRTWQSPDSGRLYSEDLFFFAWLLPSTANGSNWNATGVPMTPVTQLVDADADFEAIQATWGTWSAGNPGSLQFQGGWPSFVDIKDGATGRRFSNIPFNTLSLFGNDGFPGIFPVARIFKAKTPLTLTITPYLTAGAAFTASWFVFQGRKIFELN